jgi:hypothetical protein
MVFFTNACSLLCLENAMTQLLFVKLLQQYFFRTTRHLQCNVKTALRFLLDFTINMGIKSFVICCFLAWTLKPLLIFIGISPMAYFVPDYVVALVCGIANEFMTKNNYKQINLLNINPTQYLCFINHDKAVVNPNLKEELNYEKRQFKSSYFNGRVTKTSTYFQQFAYILSAKASYIQEHDERLNALPMILSMPYLGL